MLQQREELLLYAQQRLAAFAEQHQLRLLHTPGNPISMAVALGDARGFADGGAMGQSWTMLGSMLFNRSVSGARVIGHGQEQAVAGMHFKNYGAHYDDYPCSYITVAAAIGTQPGEMDMFLIKLGACLVDYQKRIKPLNKQTGFPEGSTRYCIRDGPS